MQAMYRLIDANVNRVCEGIRIVEDICRFHFRNEDVFRQLRSLRHQIRMPLMLQYEVLLRNRDADSDLGKKVTKESTCDNKTNIVELVTANFKRVQEGLRAIEEALKIVDQYDLSKTYEEYRFQSYSLEKTCQLILKREQRRQCLNADLYGITAEKFSNGRSNLQVVREMLDAGIRVIQYREKDKSIGEKFKECQEIRKMTREVGALFIVNDHIDIALAVDADGVHVGQDDMPIEEVRKLVGDAMIIGLSTHSPQQGQDAVRRGVDYIGVGPIFRTHTKKDVCDPVGLEYLEYVVNNLDIPFVAIGGIKEHNIREVKQRGAKCIALVTEIVGASDIDEKIGNLREILNEGV